MFFKEFYQHTHINDFLVRLCSSDAKNLIYLIIRGQTQYFKFLREIHKKARN